MKEALCIVLAGLISMSTAVVWASTPLGFSSTSLTLSAQVNVACQEFQHGSFPSPLMIDPQSSSDQIFAASADEKVVCTSGTVFTIKATSGNGTAVDQTCTSSGISSMALKSAGAPSDSLAYTLICAGDTDGAGHFIGAGFNAPRSLGMSVKVLAADARVAVAHADYSDNVMLTISY